MKKTTYLLRAITVIAIVVAFIACTKEAVQPANSSNAGQERISVSQSSRLTKTKPINYTGGTGTSDSTKATK